ncbi:MAG: hypothetical protein KatS3mg033_1104 [Thermonema sp.]|uniref:DUF2480 family protein n=1 Tax=Thermonema TaxID=28194 RepID=UPI00056E48E7|nr:MULTISPECIES: DUF2480 family protein [Thermonema]GIV39304.1 MAG: hypothetical protein KatS3mg033_1104 [Thermonema sp.]
MKEEPIVNRVARSPLVSIDLQEFYPEGECVWLDIAPQLFQGMVLREKDFREYVKSEDWSRYEGKNVAVGCSTDAIVPVWAYMLLATSLAPYARYVTYGTLEDLQRELWQQQIDTITPQAYQDKKVVVKGCGEKPIPEYAFTLLAARLQPYVSSLMYGEPCSTVPIYKRKK